MNLAVIIQTCDRYRRFWGGMLHFMERHWDFSIEAPIYLCNEEEDADLPGWCRQIKTGRGTFVENLKRSLELAGEEKVFLMLEDFWPIAPMRRDAFEELYQEFTSKGMDALQVSNYAPCYKLRGPERRVAGMPVFDFEPDSEWIFNLQARFWRAESLKSCLREPEVSERETSSAITVEMASDAKARDSGGMMASLAHYLWYPLSGVAYRGEMTEFGKHLQNILGIDQHVESMFTERESSSTRPKDFG